MRNSISCLLPLVVLLGCAAHSPSQPKNVDLSLPEERVVGRAEWIDVDLVPLAYRRLGTDPQVGPWRILFSEQRHYCPVADSTFDELSRRALDAAIAAQVFGFVVEQRDNARTREKDFVQLVRPDSPKPQWVRVALYSGSMGAAINVELALRDH